MLGLGLKTKIFGLALEAQVLGLAFYVAALITSMDFSVLSRVFPANLPAVVLTNTDITKTNKTERITQQNQTSPDSDASYNIWPRSRSVNPSKHKIQTNL